jgi:hypothetical protein
MPWRKCMNFINNIQTNPSPLFMELITIVGGDVKNANAMEFINVINF